MIHTDPLLPALLQPDGRPALRFSTPHAEFDVSMSYAELASVAGALAERLPPAGRVAVVATPTLHTAVGITAALLAGRPAVPLNPRLGERELAHVLADAEPAAVLAAPGTVPDGPLATLPRLDVDLAPPLSPRPAGAAAQPGPEEPALVVYTSGTTGAPKGAVLSRRAVAANLDALAEAWAWTADDVLAHALPLFHVHGLVLGLLGVLRRGGALHHLGALTATTLAGAVDAGATLVFGVPTQYHRLAEELEVDPRAAATVGRARLLVSGSAALTAVDHARLLRSTGLAVRERYGLTETLIVTAARADEQPEPGTVGRPLADTRLRLAPLPVEAGDADSDGADADGLGMVEVCGPGLFSGYLNRPDATAAAATPDGWFATGDIARWTPSGALAIVGRRATDLIKSGGYKIGAGEIENALLEHPGVAECAVIGVPDDDLGERVVAFVVAAGQPPLCSALADHVGALLAPHKRPREVRFVDALPRNDLGKVVKTRLPGYPADPDQRESGTSTPAAPARSPRPAGRPGSAGAVLLGYLAEHVDRLAAEEHRARRDEPDAVHQLRVSARRLRSALQAYRPLLDRARTEPVVAQLRELGRLLAPARDAEVLNERITAGVAALAPELRLGPVQALTTRHFARVQADAGRVVLAELDGARHAALRAALDDLLAHPPLTRRADRPARRELPRVAARSARRLARAVAAATGSAAPDREVAVHEARKAAKRLRYATDVAAPAVGKPARRFAKRLKVFQKALGEHQDTVVTRGALRELAGSAHLAGQNGFSYGVLHGREGARAERIEERLPQLWAAAWKPKARRWLR